MDSLQFLKKLYEYDNWANHETLAGIGTVDGSRDKPLKYFSHVIAAQRIWRGRFDDPEPTKVEPWPVMTVEECRAAVDELRSQWIGLIGRMTDEKLGDNLVYKNLKGADLRTPIRDVLMHVVTHSVHHRGQAAAAIREAGGKPSATDYVAYVRKAKG